MESQKKINTIFFGLLLILLSSCKTDSSEDDYTKLIETEEVTKKSVEEARLNAQNVFNTIPDRRKIIKLVEDNQINYNPDFLNNPLNLNKYRTEFYKGVSLGIYGSDLNIASLFDQTQESLTFLSCVNNLASKLGVSKAFDQSMFERIEKNKNNKDSTLEIITGAFKKSDEILKTDGRSSTSAVILAGCWIEGMFVGCQMAKAVNTESLYKTIVGQEESLKNLIVMLEACTLDQAAQFLVVDLKGIQSKIKIQTNLNSFIIEEIDVDVTKLRNKLIIGG